MSAQIPMASDIFLVDADFNSAPVLFKNPINISNRIGYDNQPAFFDNSKSLYFVSMKEDLQADIYKYSIYDKSIQQLTKTSESEYSPKQTSQPYHFSVVRVEKDSSQRFREYSLLTGSSTPICAELDSIGYYCWTSEKDFVFFKITDPATLWKCDVIRCKEEKLASGIGRCMMPKNKNEIFITQLVDSTRWICSLNLKTKKIERLILCLESSEDFAVYQKHRFMMAKDAKLFTFDSKKSKNWLELADFQKHGLTKIKRISIASDLSKIAFVADVISP